MTDAEALARAMEEDGLVAGGDDYALARWLADAARTLLERVFGRVDVPETGDPRLLWVAVVLAVLVFAGALALVLWRLRLGRSARAPTPDPVRASATPTDRRRRLDALLAEGRAREALAELWPWVATRLAARGLGAWEPDRTTREFVATVPPEWPEIARLRAIGASAERLAWAGGTPTVAEVRGLVLAAESL